MVERILVDDRWRWHFRSPDGAITGHRAKLLDAVWDLFDAVIREPIRRAEHQAEAAPYYQPPVIIDGVPFTFEYRRDYGKSGVHYKVNFPQELEWKSENEPVWAMRRYTIVRHASEYEYLWSTSHNGASSSFYRLEHFLPLDLTLRWLFMHTEYLSVRQMQELGCYDHSIMRLIEAQEGLFSENTYQELLGFRPSAEPKWKVYGQDHGHFRGNKFIASKDNYVLDFQGEFAAARKALTKWQEKHSNACAVLLTPENRLADTWYPSSLHSRIKNNWKSIFGEGDEYWKLTPWEQSLHDFRTEQTREFMRRQHQSPDSNRKPN
jgi:hypothetical protein